MTEKITNAPVLFALQCKSKINDRVCLLSVNHIEVIFSNHEILQSPVISEWLVAIQLTIYNKVLHYYKL